MPPGPASILSLWTPDGAETVRRSARSAGFETTGVTSLEALFAELRNGDWAATVLSCSVTGVDERVARRVAEEPSAGALILTAPGISLERALEMEAAGATALLREPVDERELASRLTVLLDEGDEVPITTGRADSGQTVLVGESAAMGLVFETVARVADSDATVLIVGESGTGKELVARALHRSSRRRESPFVAVNCAAIPEHLLESELFGHERGAFTGAVARRVGRFERAHGGTLFLDEVGDMSPVLQAKVLRALEERCVERVGGSAEVAVDVRIIAATNRDLVEASREGRFREDLYYRLAVVELSLPPLHARGGDARDLALHFAARSAARHRRPVTAISERALRQLEEARWPGNVRELRNVMDRAVLLARGATIRSTDLRLGPAAPRFSAPSPPKPSFGYPLAMSLKEVEADHVRRVLASVDGRVGRAAEILGVHRNTLAAKVRDYGIDVRSEA